MPHGRGFCNPRLLIFRWAPNDEDHGLKQRQLPIELLWRQE
ncbi:MAG: hypothetical protein ACJ0AN_02150 [Alphaproteobacteria bacterium]